MQVNYHSGSVTIDSNTFDGGGTGIGDPYGRSLGTCHAAVYANFGSSNNTITNNAISNFGSAGISLAGADTTQSNDGNVIDRNILRNVNTALADSGAIYLLDRGHAAVGNRVTNNAIDGNGTVTQSTKAIYLDDQTSNVVVSGNVCRSCGQYAIQYHGGDHNLVTNNVFDLSSGAKVGLYQDARDPGLGLPNYGMSGNTFQRNIIYFAGSAPASLWDFDNNPIPQGGRVFDAQPQYADPGFLAPQAGDYTLAPSSPAFAAIGFQALPSDLGPRPVPSMLPQ